MALAHLVKDQDIIGSDLIFPGHKHNSDIGPCVPHFPLQWISSFHHLHLPMIVIGLQIDSGVKHDSESAFVNFVWIMPKGRSRSIKIVNTLSRFEPWRSHYSSFSQFLASSLLVSSQFLISFWPLVCHMSGCTAADRNLSVLGISPLCYVIHLPTIALHMVMQLRRSLPFDWAAIPEVLRYYFDTYRSRIHREVCLRKFLFLPCTERCLTCKSTSHKSPPSSGVW